MTRKRKGSPASTKSRRVRTPVRRKADSSGAVTRFVRTRDDEPEWDANLPWELIATFLTFPDVLAMRIVSRHVLTRLHAHTEPTTCAVWVSTALHQRNMWMAVAETSSTPDQGAIRDAHDVERILRESLGRPNDSMDALDLTLRLCRVLQNVPREMAVLYKKKYGRHCRPINAEECKRIGREMKEDRASDDDDDDDSTDLSITQLLEEDTSPSPHCPSGDILWKQFPPCHRGKEKCPSCQFRIPFLDEDNFTGLDHREPPGIDSFFAIEDRSRAPGNRSLDLGQHYPTCVPNMPSTLSCPMCRVTSRRTLVLSEVVYQTEPGTEKSTPCRSPLTYTPKYPQGGFSIPDDEYTSEEDRTSIRQRQRIDSSSRVYTTDDLFPPTMYHEMMIPLLSVGHEHKYDAKYAISLYCDYCHFGVLTPSSICGKVALGRYCQFQHLYKSTDTVGGVMIRNACAVPNCNLPVLCTLCRTYERPQCGDVPPVCVRHQPYAR